MGGHFLCPVSWMFERGGVAARRGGGMNASGSHGKGSLRLPQPAAPCWVTTPRIRWSVILWDRKGPGQVALDGVVEKVGGRQALEQFLRSRLVDRHVCTTGPGVGKAE